METVTYKNVKFNVWVSNDFFIFCFCLSFLIDGFYVCNHYLSSQVRQYPEIESYETVMENVVRPQIFFIYLLACYVIAKAILPSF